VPHASDPVARALAYHERTKHHPGRYARALGYLDWDTQPDPFRTYEPAPRVDLPLTADRVEARYGELYLPGAIAPRALDVGSLAAFLELALGITAWKEYEGSRWALRSDPSSGNLHPTEGYVVVAEAPGLAAGVHHYVSRDHALERRCALDAAAARELALRLPGGSFLFGLSSIHWRESWKYGERAFRYCQHDAGHVIATARYAAAALGWSARLVDEFGDDGVARLLGLDRERDFARVDELDREHPDAVLLVAPDDADRRADELARDAGGLAALVAAGEWAGTPNELSPDHVDWEVVHDVAEATHLAPSAATVPRAKPELGPLPPRSTPGEAAAVEIIRQRRSAVALDRITSVPRETFYAMLERTIPRRGVAPFDALPWAPALHLGIFVHRVDDLAPGLYLLERSERVHAELAAQLGERARWERPPACPEDLRLFCIGTNDYRRAAAAVSCGQEIAADGAFSLGMLAELRERVESGAHWYRRLFWESGAIGQVLYLEAEAHGVRGTGIGCYFDDAFHQLIGLEDDRFQSLYHFTVGGPVEDTRLVTHPAYAHLDRARA